MVVFVGSASQANLQEPVDAEGDQVAQAIIHLLHFLHTCSHTSVMWQKMRRERVRPEARAPRAASANARGGGTVISYGKTPDPPPPPPPCSHTLLQLLE